jgi:hypothetical protein
VFESYRLFENVVQDRRDIATKLFGIFAHRKVTELLHDRDAGTPYCRCRPPGVFRRAGEIILARKQIQRAYFSIDPLDPAAQVAAVPGHVEGDDAEIFCKRLVREQMPPLPGFAARS